MISFYNKVTHLRDEGKVVDEVSCILARLLMVSSQHSSGQIVQVCDEQVHATLGKELAECWGVRGCSEWN